MQFTNAALSLAVVAAMAATTGAFAPVSRNAGFAPASSTAVYGEDDSMSFEFVPTRRVVRKPVTVEKVEVAGEKPFFLESEEPAPTASDISPKQVRALFSLWNNALATGDSRLVASRYATKSGAVLLPTVSDTPRTDYAGIKDYFDGFLKKEPQGEILDGNIRIGDGWAQDAG